MSSRKTNLKNKEWKKTFGYRVLIDQLNFCFQFLDTVTGTYRYYHSPTNMVHLYPPEVSVSQTPPATPPMAKQKLASVTEVEGEPSKLKRSYSSPDITQDIREEGQKKPAAIPTINRDTKCVSWPLTPYGDMVVYPKRFTIHAFFFERFISSWSFWFLSLTDSSQIIANFVKVWMFYLQGTNHRVGDRICSSPADDRSYLLS